MGRPIELQRRQWTLADVVALAEVSVENYNPPFNIKTWAQYIISAAKIAVDLARGISWATDAGNKPVYMGLMRMLIEVEIGTRYIFKDGTEFAEYRSLQHALADTTNRTNQIKNRKRSYVTEKENNTYLASLSEFRETIHSEMKRCSKTPNELEQWDSGGLEEKARRVGLEDDYNLYYRWASDHVHSTHMAVSEIHHVTEDHSGSVRVRSVTSLFTILAQFHFVFPYILDFRLIEFISQNLDLVGLDGIYGERFSLALDPIDPLSFPRRQIAIASFPSQKLNAKL